jgi:beta-lactamase regulating signal transducer with metallopeptidase domain
MRTWLAAGVDTTIILACAFALTALMRRRSASLRHAVLATAVLAALAAPALERSVPRWTLLQWNDDAPSVSSAPLPVTSSSPAADPQAHVASRPRAVDAVTLIAGTWAVGAVSILLGLLLGFVRLQRLIGRSVPVRAGTWRDVADDLARASGSTRPVAIVQSDSDSLLVTCGVWHPRVVLPRGAGAWPHDRIRIVLTHELAHIRRHDGLMQLAGELLRIVHWFNPLVWLACRRLRQESEYACDDVVLGDGVEASDYASALLAVAQQASARTHTWAAAPGIAHPSTLERRIAAMLTARSNRQPSTRRMWIATALTATALMVPLTGASIAPASQPAFVPSSAGIDIPLRAIVSIAPTIASDTTAAPGASVTHVTRQPVSARAIVTAPASAPAIAPAAAPAVAGAPDAQRGVFPLAPGTLSGTAIDPTDAVLPGVSVAISSLDQSVERATVTDSSTGRFSFRDLPSGQYGVALALPGFQTIKSVETVTSGQAVARTYRLMVGVVSETIRVSCTTGAAAENAAGWGDTLRARAIEADRRVNRLFQLVMPTLSAQSGPVRVGGNLQAPRKLVDVRPPCPSTSTKGVLILETTITPDGQIQDVKALRNPFPKEVLESATEAIRQWKYAPMRLNGHPMAVIMSVTASYE